ncbi:MAG: glucosamine-6-phosphate deaminase [Eubacteriales bacterium]
MNIYVESGYNAVSLKAAKAAAEYINNNPRSLLCFAAGDTPLGMFKKLIEMQRKKEVDLSSVFYAELDEWLGLGYQDKGSCRQVMADNYYLPAGIPEGRINIFDGLSDDTVAQCRQMEEWIEMHRGIGLAVLGIGLNGHIGFNEPNAPETKGCFTVPLDEITKAVSTKYFGRITAVEQGITIGWSTLNDSKKLILLASGAKKAHILNVALNGKKDPLIPASLLRDHSDLTAIADKPAASEL